MLVLFVFFDFVYFLQPSEDDDEEEEEEESAYEEEEVVGRPRKKIAFGKTIGAKNGSVDTNVILRVCQFFLTTHMFMFIQRSSFQSTTNPAAGVSFVLPLSFAHIFCCCLDMR